MRIIFEFDDKKDQHTLAKFTQLMQEFNLTEHKTGTAVKNFEPVIACPQILDFLLKIAPYIDNAAEFTLSEVSKSVGATLDNVHARWAHLIKHSRKHHLELFVRLPKHLVKKRPYARTIITRGPDWKALSDRLKQKS